MKKAFSYTRTNKREKLKNPNYIKHQQEAIHNYCKNNKLKLVEEYDDFLPPHRYMFDLMMMRCHQRDSTDVVVITKADRIARSKEKFEDIQEQLTKNNIQLVILEEL